MVSLTPHKMMTTHSPRREDPGSQTEVAQKKGDGERKEMGIRGGKRRESMVVSQPG